MNVEILGHVCLDRNQLEDGSVFSGAGSPALFIEKILRQFEGVNPGVVAFYGEDLVPHLAGVNIYPERPFLKDSLTYENITRDGFRRQLAHNRGLVGTVPIDETVRERLGKADIVFFAPILPNFSPDYYKEAAMAAPNALKVLLPQGHFRNFDEMDNVIYREFEEANEVLPFVDLLIMSRDDFPTAFEISKRWSDKHNLVAVVTKGADGAFVYQNGDKGVDIPTERVDEKDVVDSVGSGDIFSAGFAYRLKQTGDAVEAGRFANALARQCLFYPADRLVIDLSSI